MYIEDTIRIAAAKWSRVSIFITNLVVRPGHAGPCTKFHSLKTVQNLVNVGHTVWVYVGCAVGPRRLWIGSAWPQETRIFPHLLPAEFGHLIALVIRYDHAYGDLWGKLGYFPIFVNSAFHPSEFGKWVPAIAGKAKEGMAHSDCGWTFGCAGKTVRSLENTFHTQCYFSYDFLVIVIVIVIHFLSF